MARVKRCPACPRENPSTSLFCACGASLATVPLTEATVPAGVEKADPLPITGDRVICPDPSCGHPNQTGSARCALCNSALAQLPAAAPGLRLSWPWGAQRLTGRLPLGRDLEFSPLADRLASFPNLSRRHAELWVADGALWVQDLGSMNGTYIDGAPLAPHHPQRLQAQVRVRFGGTADALELRLDCSEEPEHDDPAA